MTGMFRFMRFGLVGALGFVVDAGVMQLLVSFAGVGAIEARAISIPTAVLATWVLNRTFTFGKTADRALPSLVRYAAVSAGGAAVNFIVYSALILASSTLAARPMIPL